MGRAFAISDIHGCAKTFIALVEDVVQLKKEDTLYLLGDYIDRGPDSKGVIDYILRLKETGFQVIVLRGNHEQMLVLGMGDPSVAEMFLANGGVKTLVSFGVTQPDHLDPAYLSFFNSMECYAIYKHFILVHAGLNFDIPDPLQDKRAMLWTRKFKVSSGYADKVIVHGHTPTALMDIQESILNVEKESQINIDNGCVYGLNEFYGNLCCLDLDNLKLYIQPNIDLKPLF